MVQTLTKPSSNLVRPTTEPAAFKWSYFNSSGSQIFDPPGGTIFGIPPRSWVINEEHAAIMSATFLNQKLYGEDVRVCGLFCSPNSGQEGLLVN